VLLIYMGR